MAVKDQVALSGAAHGAPASPPGGVARGLWGRARGSELTAIAVIAVLLVVLGLNITREDWLLQGSIALTFAVAATGLGVALGLAGEFVLAQAAIFGTAAYTAAVLTSVHGWSFWPAAVAGMVVAMAAGLVLSLPGLRLSHFYFGMLGFYLVFLVPAIAQMLSSQTGGSDGLAVALQPTMFGEELGVVGLFLLATAALTLTLLLVRNVRRSPLGTNMRRMRDAPVVLAAAGVSVWRVRLGTYALCSVLAGLGGTTYSHLSGFLQPGEFGFETTNLLFAAVLVGGSTTLLGPTLGVLLLYIVPRLVINIEGYSDIVYGLTVLLAVILLPGGIEPAIRRLAARLRRCRPEADVAEAAAESAGGAGDVRDLVDMLMSLRTERPLPASVSATAIRRSFGGVRALDFDDESRIDVRPGRVVSLLGPNGSGKTTALNAISGLVKVDAGAVHVGDREVTGWPAARIAREGMSRSFQSPALPDEVTPVELLVSALQRIRRVSYVHWLLGDLKARRVRRESENTARRIASSAGLGPAADLPCRGLTSGQRRIVDVLLALVADSTIVLLDEPAAGLSELDRQRLAALVGGLAAGGLGFLVVEHDLDLALSMADEVTVLVQGRPAVQGPPDEIRSSPIVRDALIGAPA